MRRPIRFVLACASLLFLPATTFAQASITGVVHDSSGAVLPGVTVEETSPALIEKARSVVTDGSGQYRIITLPPGTYTISFTLSGFSTVRREGVELAGTFTATVDADLRVGSVEETVTVTGDDTNKPLSVARVVYLCPFEHDAPPVAASRTALGSSL